MRKQQSHREMEREDMVLPAHRSHDYHVSELQAAKVIQLWQILFLGGGAVDNFKLRPDFCPNYLLMEEEI